MTVFERAGTHLTGKCIQTKAKKFKTTKNTKETDVEVHNCF